MRLEGKQIGVFIALILGVIILFMPSRDNARYSFDPDRVAKNIIGNEDHIDPATLSQWIIEGRRDYMLIDIRSSKEFERGHIKTAENIPLDRLLLRNTLESLPVNKLMVIYSNGSSHASQAWLVMKAAGFDSYILEGGYNYWCKAILNPVSPSGVGEISDDEILLYKEQLAVKNYFGGSSTPAVNEAAQGNQPKKTVILQPKKKKLKGC
jgi:rhodanese-related sulfurtransferase